MNDYENILEQLKNGELKSFEVEKENFLAFREKLVEREDFKHFRGEAKQGGGVIFTYLKEARS